MAPARLSQWQRRLLAWQAARAVMTTHAFGVDAAAASATPRAPRRPEGAMRRSHLSEPHPGEVWRARDQLRGIGDIARLAAQASEAIEGEKTR
jgi:hypothetical protein